MSMFHELMMRKKEQIMYATIKGTLTENDGVFSGFSASNYLQIQDTFNLQDIKEIVVKINLPSSALNNNKYEFILVKGNFRINCYSYATYFGATGIDVTGVGNISFGTNFQPDTDYWLKYKNDGVNCSCAYSTDGINWIAGASKSASSISSSTSITYLGIRKDNNAYFDGSIDLNNSYIKLGSTKYNLQAVVGYTVVGSPTITDGVVSGFSSANYLTLPEMNTSSFEFVLKIKTPAGFTSLEGLISEKTTTTYKSRIQFNAYGNISLLLSSNGTSFDIANTLSSVFLLVNTIYYIKFTFDGTKYVVSFSADGTSYETAITINSTTSLRQLPYIIGLNNGNNVAFTSSIDILNSYIKINNKLWFNGQQA